MKKIKVIALRDHSPNGSDKYKKGQTYEISESAAKILVATHCVKYATVETEPKKKNEYRTRRMTAEK